MPALAINRLAGWQPNRPKQILGTLLTWKGVMAGWGVCAGVAAVFLAERIPAFRRDVFCKIPLIGDRWQAYRAHEDDEAPENGTA